VPLSRSPRRAAAALALGAAVLTTSGCIGSDTDINGVMGVGVDEGGRPVLVGEVCHGVVVRVDVSGPNRGDQPNEQLADLTAEEPVTGSFTLDPADPGAGWTGRPLALPLGPELHIAYASGGEEADSQLGQVTFTAADLAALRPGQVLSERSDGPVDAEAFADLACDER